MLPPFQLSFQLIDPEDENTSPYFDETVHELVRDYLVRPGVSSRLILPPIVDRDGDRVIAMAEVDH